MSVEGFYTTGTAPKIETYNPDGDDFFEQANEANKMVKHKAQPLVKEYEPVPMYLEKPLPSSPESERVILGGILLDNRLMEEAYHKVSAEDMYSPLHRRVYKAMTTLFDKGLRIDPILIGEEMKKDAGSLEAIGGIGTITNLTYGLPHFSNIAEYAKIVKDKAVARNLIKACNEIISETLAEEMPIENTLLTSENKVMALATERARGLGNVQSLDYIPLSEIAPILQNQFTAFNEGLTNGISTGMPEVDIMLDGGGLQGGGLYIVMGAEKSGKTSLALDWASDISINQGFWSLINTAEMKKETLAKRMFSAYSGIPYYAFRTGFSDTKEHKWFTEAQQKLKIFGQKPVAISDKQDTMAKVRRYMRRKVEHGLRPGNVPVKVGVIDYAQLMELDDNSYKMNDTEKIGKVSREAKLLASELDIPIVMMTSMNRTGLGVERDSDGNKRAIMGDTNNMRGNQQIAFDAEAVFLVHNPAYIPGEIYVPQDVTDIQLIILRQRNGPTGMIPLKFIGQYMQFMSESQYNKFFGSGRVTNVDTEKMKAELEDAWAD